MRHRIETSALSNDNVQLCAVMVICRKINCKGGRTQVSNYHKEIVIFLNGDGDLLLELVEELNKAEFLK